MPEVIRNWWRKVPPPLGLLLAMLWYGLLLGLALVGAIEPHASFQYLAM